MSVKTRTVHKTTCDQCNAVISAGKHYLEIHDKTAEGAQTKTDGEPNIYYISYDYQIDMTYPPKRKGPRQFCSWRCARKYGKCDCGTTGSLLPK